MKKGREKQRYQAGKARRGLQLLTAAALCTTQIAGTAVIPVSAQTLEYEGTTQLSTTELYPQMDTSAVKLIVEEVYVEAGDRIAEGGNLLKLTEDSYQAALDYYAAAIIYAENDLVNEQMAYDQGMQEAQYTLDLASADADQAEFVRDQSIEELEDTIEEHVEVMTELEEAISECEEGIADGSYDSSDSSSGSASSGSGSSGSGSQSSQEDGQKDSQESDQDQTGNGMPETNQNGQSEQESETQTESTAETEISVGTDNSGSVTELQNQISELKASQTTLNSQIAEKDQKYNEVLLQMYKLAGLDTENFCGVGGSETKEETPQDQKTATLTPQEGVRTSSAEEEDTELPGETVAAASARASDAEETEAPASEPAAPETPAAQTPETTPETAAPETTAPEETVIDAQTESKETSKNTEQATSGKTDTAGQTATGSQSNTSEQETQTEAATLESLLAQLNQMEQARSNLYSQLNEVNEQLEQAQTRLEELEKGTNDSTQESGSGQNTSGTDGNVPNGSGNDGTQNGAGQTGAAGMENTGSDGTQTGSEAAGNTSDSQGNVGSMQGETGSTGNASAGTMPSGSAAESSADAANGGSSAMASGQSAAAAAGGSQGGSSVMAAEQGTSSMGGGAEGGGQQSDTDSLFGDTYDLTDVKNLLEQTPSSTDDAEEWLEKLQDSMETVALQYAELTREEEATRLEIQYTYDTTILAGSLAEITYEQETAELEETLQEAKDALEELKEAKALLETYENGVITSDQAGTIAAVNYEADDVLNASVALCSFYDTSTVAISIEVPQEEIAALAVGASVDVTVTGYGDREGTILEKGTEAVSGESRTNVNYLGTIQLDNSDGRLTSNLAAKITVSDEEETENE